ncbi:hypothetical protein [Nocardia sp.]|uniref:hypothetical protein n=1 Tax=Nocardia sp. TaxID=1821 RepID=UPI0026044223|nr:hypothetical protein [Nocardia sp.]
MHGGRLGRIHLARSRFDGDAIQGGKLRTGRIHWGQGVFGGGRTDPRGDHERDNGGKQAEDSYRTARIPYRT